MTTFNRTAALLIGLLIAMALAGGVIYGEFAMQRDQSAVPPTVPTALPSDVTTIFVGPELRDCEGMGPMNRPLSRVSCCSVWGR